MTKVQYLLALQVVDFELSEVSSISVPVAKRGVTRAVMIGPTSVTTLCLVATSVCENDSSKTALERLQCLQLDAERRQKRTIMFATIRWYPQ